MPLRLLGYAARTLEKMVPDTAIYSTALQKFPIPEFYVIYTGEDSWEDRVLRLSDGFLRQSDDKEIPENSMELVVKIINVGYNEHNEVIKRSRTLEGYSRLIHYIKENRKDGMSKEAAVDEAIDRCVEEGFLVEFLKNKREVSKMILGNNITMEEYGRVQRENGRLEGLEIFTYLSNHLKEGLSKETILSDIIKKFALSEDEAAKFYEQARQTL